MTENERIGIYVLIGLFMVCLTVGTIVWHAYNARAPLSKLRHDRQIEEVRACAHAVDVTSCLRDATG